MESEIYNTYVWLCDRGWPDSVIDPLLSNTEDHEITDKSPARFHLKTPPPFVVWHSTCRFYAFNNFSNMASHLQDLWAIWKLHHLQFLHQGLPPAVFEKSTTCRSFCLQQFLHQGVPPAVLKTPPPADSLPPAAAQMGNLFVCSRESLQLASGCNNIIQYPALHFKCNRWDQIPSNCASGNMQI